MIDLKQVDDNAFHTSDFKGRDLKELTDLEWFQFAKANKVFAEPGISAEELDAIHTALEKVIGPNPATIVETGMCYGTTTRYFLVRNLKYGGTLTNYELFTRPKFKEAMEELGLWDNIIRKGHSMLDTYDEKPIDILWIDSEHALQDALGEYMRFRLFLRQGAIVGFHDSDCCAGVEKAIEMVQEVDELELVTELTGKYSAGCKLFKFVNRNREDRPWNSRMRK